MSRKKKGDQNLEDENIKSLRSKLSQENTRSFSTAVRDKILIRKFYNYNIFKEIWLVYIKILAIINNKILNFPDIIN